MALQPEWTVVEGTKVWRIGKSNFVAYPNNGRKSAAYHLIIQLMPREEICQLRSASDMRSWLIKAYLQEHEAPLPAGEPEPEPSQPGFYITEGDDVEGPYETLDEAIDDAIAYDRKKKGYRPINKPLCIIETDSPVKALLQQGHVWWIKGLMKGPPVSPRQRTFNF